MVKSDLIKTKKGFYEIDYSVIRILEEKDYLLKC